LTDFSASKDRLLDCQNSLDCSLGSLLKAIEDTAKLVDGIRQVAKSKLEQLIEERGLSEKTGADIVAFGSLARGEMSTESDFDYLLVAYDQITNPDYIRTIREVGAHAKEYVELPSAGAHTGFGQMVSALDLVNLIGLDSDTNRHHTARILLLEESAALLDEVGHSNLVEAVLARYLYDYLHGPGQSPLPKQGVPRFLLNDIVRYWRTVAVDYQSKRWVELRGEKWGMRYLKLRSTRKLVFVGTLISLFMPRLQNVDVTPVYLREQFALTPLARIAQLEGFLSDAGKRDLLKQILLLAQEFYDQYSEPEFRKTANQVEYPNDPGAPEEFRAVRSKTIELEDVLESFFSSAVPLLGPQALPNGEPLTLSHLRDRYLLF
jgi:predicted nucleotidyltransferase